MLAVLYPSTEAEAGLIDQTGYTQPALFALEYALCRLWQSWGVQPEVVLGHSVGEYVAACVAGVFSLEDGLSLIAARGRLMQALPSGGSMVSVLAELERVEPALVGLEGQVSVAALNAPDSVVVSGVAAAVEEVVSRLSAEGIENHFLQVSHAFHSPLMEPMLEEFERLAAAGSYGAPRLRLVSNRTGREVGAGEVDGAYWVAHVREAVRFQAGLSRAVELGCEAFVEVGPHPVLCALGRRGVTDPSVSWLGSLRRGVDDWSVLSESVVRLYARGVEMDWPAFEQLYGGRPVALPTYPFQRQKYWLSRGNPFARSSGATAAVTLEATHPLVGARFRTAGQETIFQTELRPDMPAFLDDHRVHGKVVFPATAYWEMALGAAAEARPGQVHGLQNVALEAPLVLHADETCTVQVVLRASGASTSFEIFSLDETPAAAEQTWRRHATGALAPSTPEPEAESVSIQELRQVCSQPVEVGDHYSRMRAHGMDYGPAFQGIEELWRGDGQSLARLELPEHLAGDAGHYALHPALLDACLQVLGANLADGDNEEIAYLPVALGQLEVRARPGTEVWCHATLHERTNAPGDTASGDLRLLDPAGRVVASLQKLYLKRATRQAIARATGEATTGWLHHLEWRRLEAPAGDAAAALGSWLILDDQEGVGEALAEQLRAAGGTATLVRPGAAYQEASANGGLQVDPLEPADFRRLLEAWSAADGCRSGVVHLWSLDTVPGARTTPASLRTDQEFECGSVLHLVQALSDLEGDRPRLLLATRGAQAVEAEPEALCPVQALLWGLGRVVASEHPDLRCTLVDLESAPSVTAADNLLKELQTDDPESQIAYRRGERYGARLVRWQDDTGLEPPADQLFQLQISARGVLDNLGLV